ncbi:MAG: DnaJ domain-containing protein [Paludibacteraceae bacterium]|nr:DnaJ domain-containing protein [Paludibacteraceae bacterium]
MFRDYYAILEVSYDASPEEIKSAYRQLSKKWHPDVNPDVEVTSKMQDINEAYCVLKDAEKRRRYDEEYKRFKQFQQTSNKTNSNHTSTTSSTATSSSKSYYYDYNVNDESVWNDMESARAEATRLVREFLNNLKKDGKNAATGAWESIYPYIIVSIVFTIIGLIIHALY